MKKLYSAIEVIIKECNLKTEDDEEFCYKVAKRMQENFCGYKADFSEIFKNRILNKNKISSAIEFKKVRFTSHCLHHMTPIIGYINISYAPNEYIVGFSRIIECVNAFTQRLQLQENLTVEIAECINKNITPKGVMIEVVARHYCMQKSPNDTMPQIRTCHKIGEI